MSTPRIKSPWQGMKTDSIIEMGGKRFVEVVRGDAGLPHLFGAIPTGFDGTFKRYKRRVDFHIGGFRVAVLNQYGVLAKVTRLDDGRDWYSYGTPEGCDHIGYGEACRIRDDLRVSTDWRGNNPIYSYKGIDA